MTERLNIAQLFTVVSLDPLYFCGISCNISFLHNFIYLSPLSFFLVGQNEIPTLDIIYIYNILVFYYNILVF